MAGEIFIARQDTLESVKSDTVNILDKISKKANNILIKAYTAGEDLETGNVVEIEENKVIKSKLKNYNNDDMPIKTDKDSIFFHIGTNKMLQINKHYAQFLIIRGTSIFLGTKLALSNDNSVNLSVERLDDNTFLLSFYSSKGSFYRTLHVNDDSITLGGQVSSAPLYEISFKRISNTKVVAIYKITQDDSKIWGRVINIENKVITLGSALLISDKLTVPHPEHIFLCENNRLFMYCFSKFLLIEINDSNINIIDSESIFESRYAVVMTRLEGNKFLFYGDSEKSNFKGISMIIKISGNNIIVGQEFEHSYGFRGKVIKLTPEKVLLISTEKLEKNYYRILRINNMTIENSEEIYLTTNCFYSDAYKLDANRILCYGFSDKSEVAEAHILIVGKDDTVTKTSVSYSGMSKANIFPKIVPVCSDKILTVATNSDQEGKYLRVFAHDGINFASKEKSLVINNPILGIVESSGRAGSLVNILLKGTYTFTNLTFEENSKLNNVNGELKSSYIPEVEPYANVLDQHTIEILRPYSSENTL